MRFAKSSNGTSWGDGEFNNNDIVISDGPGSIEQLAHPSIAVDDEGKLYCIWLDDRNGEMEIRMSTSNSTGNYWSPSRIVTELTGAITEPMIRYSSKVGLSIVYVEERIRTGGSVPQKDIMFSWSTDEGETFSSPKAINDDTTEYDQIHPKIVISSSGRIGIIWQDNRGGGFSSSEIYLTYSDNGQNFSPNIMAGLEKEDARRENPDMAFSDKDDIIAVWQEMGIDGWRIRYSMGWLSSPTWDGEMIEDKPAIKENLSRLDQFSPKVGYINGAYFISWTEVDLRDFFLVRTGYLSRNGEMVLEDHIVDDTIDWGMFINDPIYHAEMYRETVMALGYEDRAQVFWLDHRTDINPSNQINEDADPYTAKALGPENMPLPPEKPQLSIDQSSWSWIKLKWSISEDVEFKGYYLTYGEGTVDDPDENINDASYQDRLQDRHTFASLKPDTDYEFKLMVKDRMGNEVLSNVLRTRTPPNQPPIFTFLEPDGVGDTADEDFIIRWSSSDLENIADYSIFYDDDLDPTDQVFLYSGNTQTDGGERSFLWNTSGLQQGGYTLNATIDDGVNEPVTIYSKAIIISHPGQPKDHLRVLSVIVEGGRDGAYVDPTLQITFDEDLATSTLTEENLVVLDSNQRKVSGSISVRNSRIIEWRPSSLLFYSTRYSLFISPNVKDMEGNELDGEGVGEPSSYTLTFNTRSDSKDPEIRDYGPKGSNAPLWPEIFVRFDIPIASDTINNDTVRVKGPEGEGIPLGMEYAPNDLTLHIRTLIPLNEQTSYSVNLSRSIVSIKGANILPFEWAFTTGNARMEGDIDSDGVVDDLDWFPYDPNENMDTDGDGKGDNRDEDDDNDEMPDEWEIKYDLDPKDPTDAEGDLDEDGVSNLDEYRDGTDPGNEDDNGISFLTAVFIVIALSVLVLGGLIIFAVVQRKKMEEDRLQKGFFKQKELEE
jgi:hypothetical protein